MSRGAWVAAWAALVLAPACRRDDAIEYPPQSTTPTAGVGAPGFTPGTPSLGPAPGGVSAAFDPINNVDIVWMRQRSQELLATLVSALDPIPQGRVAGIPLVIDDTPGDVNAYAACTSGGSSTLAITDGLMEIVAQLAQARATDETFGGDRTARLAQYIAANQPPGQPIVRPPLGFWDPTQHVDSRKVARQHVVFDEAMAFILGHELAHHYLGHLPCTASPVMLTPSEIANVLSGVVPALNQPNELAADTFGIQNVLSAGARQPTTAWTEGGALLTMQFFSALDGSSALDIFAFERSHPPPSLRSPVIVQSAAGWRAAGGRGHPVL